MATLQEIVAFCDQRTRQTEIKDFDGAHNGLQIENDGSVKKIGAAVDAGQLPFEEAIAEGIDFLICHHGLLYCAFACPLASPLGSSTTNKKQGTTFTRGVKHSRLILWSGS